MGGFYLFESVLGMKEFIVCAAFRKRYCSYGYVKHQM